MAERLAGPIFERLGPGWRWLGDDQRDLDILLHESGLWVEVADQLFTAQERAVVVAAVAMALDSAVGAARGRCDVRLAVRGGPDFPECRAEVVARHPVDAMSGGVAMASPSSTLWERLTLARRQRGLTVEQLAARAGLAERTVHGMGKRQKAAPAVDTVERLARVLEVSPAWLVWGEQGGRHV